MIVYNVTIKVTAAVHEEWLDWMKSVHIPDVLKTGFFHDYKIFRLLDPDDLEGVTYAIQYYCNSMEDYLSYRDHHAPALQKEHKVQFPTQCVAFRSLLMQV
jgi:hypothetical protein